MDEYGRRLTDYMPPAPPPQQERDPAQADFVERFMSVFRRLREQQAQPPRGPMGQPQRPQSLQGINPQMPPQQQMQPPVVAPGFTGGRG